MMHVSEIISVRIRIKGQEVELSVEEARQLKRELDTIMGHIEYIPVPIRIPVSPPPPYPGWPYVIITTGGVPYSGGITG